MEKCFNCQSQQLELEVVDIITPVGQHKVSDKTISRPVCVDCGAYKLSAKELEGVELREVRSKSSRPYPSRTSQAHRNDGRECIPMGERPRSLRAVGSLGTGWAGPRETTSAAA